MTTKQALDTPYILIDLNKVELNINAMQKIAERNGVSVRPHAKTHKIPQLAHMQIKAGAIGITVAKIGEAEVMADAGIPNILIAYPLVGSSKLDRLMKLTHKTNITVALDSYEVAYNISAAASQAGSVIGVLLEVDCGFARVGLQPDHSVLELAKQVQALPGLVIKGILTFGGQAYSADTVAELADIAYKEGQLAVQMADMLTNNGIPAEIVSVGSTPASRFVAEVKGVTDIRPGTYIFGDLTQVKLGAHALENCALTVKVTIVSRPSEGRAVIDAGTKVFSMDGEDSPLGTGRGWVMDHPGIQLEWLNEEHGMLKLSPEDYHLAVGDTLEIIPVHCCAVINLMDEAAALRGDEVEAIWPISARGKVR